MKKILLLATLVFITAFAIEMMSVGNNDLILTDGTNFTNETIVGAETLWTAVYGFYNEQFGGYFSLSVDIDTFNGCSSKVEIIIEQGNDDEQLNVVTSLLTYAAAVDWDTSFAISEDIEPMAFFRLGLFLNCGTNDSVKASNFEMFGQ